VVRQPTEQSVILLDVVWPAHPRQAATLLLALASDDVRSVPLLSEWCTNHESVAPRRLDGAELELRRRQSTDRVRALLMAEDVVPALRA
jgi:hypothetical protein